MSHSVQGHPGQVIVKTSDKRRSSEKGNSNPLQYSCLEKPLDPMKSHCLEKTLMLGKVESKRRTGQQRLRYLDSITNSVDMNLSKLWEIVEDRGAWQPVVLQSMGVPKRQTQLNDGTSTADSERVGHGVVIMKALPLLFFGPKLFLWTLFAPQDTWELRVNNSC